MGEDQKKQEEKKEEKSLFSFSSPITFTITYGNFPSIEFNMRRQMSMDAKKARQEFYSLRFNDQSKKRHDYRVKQIAGLLNSHPTNLTDYPENLSPGEAFIEYCSNENAEEFVTHVWTIYEREAYPKEAS